MRESFVEDVEVWPEIGKAANDLPGFHGESLTVYLLF